jgi:hypothetical protein
MPRLFHVSEIAGISRFEPRPGRGADPLVWAIAEERLHNYLLPRECPRVTCYALTTTTHEDRARFLGSAPSVVAIEKGWLTRVRTTPLSIYEFGSRGFKRHDEVAGYYTSPEGQSPIAETCVESALAELEEREVEIRVLDSLWALREAVADSSLGFSIIRFRNAAPAPTGYQSHYPVPGEPPDVSR